MFRQILIKALNLKFSKILQVGVAPIHSVRHYDRLHAIFLYDSVTLQVFGRAREVLAS
jgi:hypothetical protein